MLTRCWLPPESVATWSSRALARARSASSIRSTVASTSRDLLEPGEQAQVLRDRQPPVERRLLRHPADLAVRARRPSPASARWIAGEDREQRRLAGAVGADAPRAARRGATSRPTSRSAARSPKLLREARRACEHRGASARLRRRVGSTARHAIRETRAREPHADATHPLHRRRRRRARARGRCSALLPRPARAPRARPRRRQRRERRRRRSGSRRRLADELFDAGVDVITLGNHAYRHREVYPLPRPRATRILRPANYLRSQPGRGTLRRRARRHAARRRQPLGQRLPARRRTRRSRRPTPLLDELDEAGCDHILVDFHAEATSEKVAMGWHLDGRVTAVVGTHTHVPTADAPRPARAAPPTSPTSA